MIEQDRITVKKFNPEDLIYTGESIETARQNQVMGPAYSYFLDNKFVGCGGVRIRGVAEAWAKYTPEAMEHLSGVLLHSRTVLDQIIRDQKLWRIWAEMNVDDDRHRTFLKHMNFREIEAFVRG
jgi:hypothetical protein